MTKDKIKDNCRGWEWALISIALLAAIWFLAPAQLSVVLYKIALITTFAFVGYWIDRRVFYYARPGELAADDTPVFEAACYRRAIIMAAVILAGALAL